MKLTVMLEKPKISIIIVNYRSAEPLKRCLLSLHNDRSVSKEILIYDNSCGADDLGFAKASNVRVIVSTENIGFGRACNYAAKEALGEFFLFLNPDTKIYQGELNRLLDPFTKEVDIGAVGATLVISGGLIQPWSYGSRVTLLSIIRNKLRFFERKRNFNFKKDQFVDWVSGAALCIKSSYFHHMGGFDRRFFMYFEDVDLCRRIQNEGKRIVRRSALQILHIGGESFKKESSSQKKYYYDSQERYFRKHQGVVQSKIIRLLRTLFG